MSSLQFDRAERGFSFSKDGLLDMRMDQSDGITARELIQQCDEEELADILWKYGEERCSRRIARAIILAEQKGVSLPHRPVGPGGRKGRAARQNEGASGHAGVSGLKNRREQ